MYEPLTREEHKEIAALPQTSHRALSIRQPWLFALIDENTSKTIENRTWFVTKTPFWILLHASSAPAQKSEVKDEKLQAVIKTAERSKILAIARVASIRKMDEADRGKPFVSGPYLWQLDRIVRINPGVPCKGSLNRWYVEDAIWNVCLERCAPRSEEIEVDEED
jgi:hypothetical protein